MTKAQTHQRIVGENDLWETPPNILTEAKKLYGIDPILDVCATDKNHKLKNYFTISDNALTKDWNKDFFMNPPYSEITTWMSKAYHEHLKWNVTASILVFGKISVKWFHKFVYDHSTNTWKGEFIPLNKRIKFLLNGIEPRWCKHCKTRFIENITHCKTCTFCKICELGYVNGCVYCEKCDSNTQKAKVVKSSPTYDSCWIIFRRKK